MELVRDVLDAMLLDREGTEMGRVDGVILRLRDDGPPIVHHLELGVAVLAGRISPRLERIVEAIRKRWSIRRTARYGIPWAAVTEITPRNIGVDLLAHDTPALDWERWLRKHVVEHLPGGKE